MTDPDRVEEKNEIDPVTEIDPRYRKLLPGEKYPRGHFTGWCMRCGADCFNFIRHRCPRPIEPRVAQYLVAVSVYVKARRILRASTIDTYTHALAKKAEAEAFEYLAAAFDEFQSNTTNGTEG